MGGPGSDTEIVHACQSRIVTDLKIEVEDVPETVSLSGRVAELTPRAPDVMEVGIELQQPAGESLSRNRHVEFPLKRRGTTKDTKDTKRRGRFSTTNLTNQNESKRRHLPKLSASSSSFVRFVRFVVHSSSVFLSCLSCIPWFKSLPAAGHTLTSSFLVKGAAIALAWAIGRTRAGESPQRSGGRARQRRHQPGCRSPMLRPRRSR